ncbi:MAG: cytochrome c peroxidase [Marinobacter sp.]|uniref:cytochrome-c peroxidase n=1 Tax=Marinobacter sp. TaxID=50741 RepID=UPI00299E3CC2|nr:cytochrome c peroxidase [Marinobacter sp.]MDX1757697.1 cytochrome c peroxidase [Marinobacter sp.]
MSKWVWPLLAGTVLTSLAPFVQAGETEYVFEAGHPSLQHWLMPEEVPFPEANNPTEARVELGKKLFFDPRLSGDGNMSCATCHNPVFGWSDGMPTAKGFQSRVLGRATPTITNTAFNALQMWDGRKDSLEDQALGPMVSSVEMNVDLKVAQARLMALPGYRTAFDAAYPGEGITDETLAKAIASYERTIISTDSPFDQWVRGDEDAMTEAQINGFKVFVDPDKGNCAVCHSAPNFTDDGFHNIGLASYGEENPDMGRYVSVPLASMKGAFKTPTLRDVTETAPYFHDGSAKTLEEVIEHYALGGTVKDNLSPNMKELDLTTQEKADLLAFLQALTESKEPIQLPDLPL